MALLWPTAGMVKMQGNPGKRVLSAGETQREDGQQVHGATWAAGRHALTGGIARPHLSGVRQSRRSQWDPSPPGCDHRKPKSDVTFNHLPKSSPVGAE